MTKKLFPFLLAITVIAFSCGEKQDKITVKGSDTVLPLTQKFAEVYSEKHGGSVTVIGGGSGVGISALENGTTNIAMASRSLKEGEKIKLQGMNKDFEELTIGFDALAMVVHPSNPVSQLTREQAEAIFTGEVTNWSEVGGPDLEIVAYSRETSSGTYEFFKKSVMKKKNYGANILMMAATGAIMQSVSQTEGAIGYVGLAYVNDEVKTIDVSYDGGKTFITPNFENAKNRTYPVFRPLFYYYLKAEKENYKAFLDFVMSDDGQNLVKAVGYVPAQ